MRATVRCSSVAWALLLFQCTDPAPITSPTSEPSTSPSCDTSCCAPPDVPGLTRDENDGQILTCVGATGDCVSWLAIGSACGNLYAALAYYSESSSWGSRIWRYPEYDIEYCMMHFLEVAYVAQFDLDLGDDFFAWHCGGANGYDVVGIVTDYYGTAPDEFAYFDKYGALTAYRRGGYSWLYDRCEARSSTWWGEPVLDGCANRFDYRPVDFPDSWQTTPP